MFKYQKEVKEHVLPYLKELKKTYLDFGEGLAWTSVYAMTKLSSHVSIHANYMFTSEGDFIEIPKMREDDDNLPRLDYCGNAIPNKESGLYLIVTTHFDPHTDEHFYWVKVGKSQDLHNRMSQYDTNNPMTWKIDFYYTKNITELEIKCHNQLKKLPKQNLLKAMNGSA